MFRTRAESVLTVFVAGRSPSARPDGPLQVKWLTKRINKAYDILEEFSFYRVKWCRRGGGMSLAVDVTD